MKKFINYDRRYMMDMIPIAVVKMFNVLISYILFFGRIVNVYHQEGSAKIIIVFNYTNT